MIMIICTDSLPAPRCMHGAAVLLHLDAVLLPGSSCAAKLDAVLWSCCNWTLRCRLHCDIGCRGWSFGGIVQAIASKASQEDKPSRLATLSVKSCQILR